MGAYEHRQFGLMYLVAAPIVAVVGLIPALLFGLPISLSALAAAALLGLMMWFGFLNTRVDASGMSWWFGPGFPGGSLPFDAIERYEATTTNLFEGFGIHWTFWHGWLWNTGGFRAVTFYKRGGGRTTIGTDDPDGLLAALDRFRR